MWWHLAVTLPESLLTGSHPFWNQISDQTSVLLLLWFPFRLHPTTLKGAFIQPVSSAHHSPLFFLSSCGSHSNKESLLRSENLRVVWHRDPAVEGPVITLSPQYHCHVHDRFCLLSALSSFRQVTQSLWYLVVLSLNPVMWSKVAPSARIW